MIVLGVVAFILFIMGDINDAYIRKKALKPCFTVGLLFLATATVCRIDMSKTKIIWLIFATIFLLYLLKSLFGSFSNSEAYADKPENREVVDTGIYALCRHPGVLFFAGLYMCLHLGISLPLKDAIIYITLNVILAVLEDKFFFPEFLEGYDKYKKKVPFLFPTKESIKNSLNKNG